MTISGTNLDSLPQAGTQGWNIVYDDNIQEIATKINGPLLTGTNSSMGDDAVADAALATATSPSLTPVSGTPDDANINANDTELKAKIDALILDNAELRTKINAILSALRKTSGCGVLDG